MLTLFFNKSAPLAAKNQRKGFLGLPEIRAYEKYFDLPAVIGKNKRESLNYIKERVWAGGNYKDRRKNFISSRKGGLT